MSIKNEGTIVFWLRHHHKDWPTDSAGYNFGLIKMEDVAVAVVKHPEKQLEIEISGPFDQGFTFFRPMPHCEENACHVAITWKDNYVRLYLNGKQEETKSLFVQEHGDHRRGSETSGTEDS